MAVERRAARASVLAVLVLAGLFAGGLARLFQLRFAAGDVYPPYSSLRSDPLGTKALHDGLREVGIPVRRAYRSLPEAPEPAATLLFLGLPPAGADRAPRALAEALEAAARGGARVVLCLRAAPSRRERPRAAGPPPAEEAGGEEPGAGPEERGSDPEEGEEPAGEPPEPEAPWSSTARSAALGDRWGFSLETAPLASRPARAERAPGADGLPAEMPWHSPVTLTGLGEPWRVLYTVAGRPVVAERTLGAGTLVLVTDSYLVSNEALWRERRPAFLSWLAGGGGAVVFDEAHLGVVEDPGIAALARRLGLHGGLPALAALFLLFAWKRAAPLGGVAPPSSTPGLAFDAGERDAAAGLENLLRRSIPPGRLLPACVAEWERVGAPRGPAGEAVRHRLRRTLATSGGDPVLTYRRLCRALAESGGLRPEGVSPRERTPQPPRGDP